MGFATFPEWIQAVDLASLLGFCSQNLSQTAVMVLVMVSEDPESCSMGWGDCAGAWSDAAMPLP